MSQELYRNRFQELQIFPLIERQYLHYGRLVEHTVRKSKSMINTVMKKKPGLKQFPWIKTIFMFLDPDYKKYSIF